MSQIYDILKTIGDFFVSIIELLGSIVTGIIDLLKMIPQAAAMVKDAVDVLPDFVLPFAIATITVTIIFMIVGRGGTDG